MAIKHYLNERELSERIGVSVRTLQKWRLFGKGPPYRKFHSAVRYSETELTEWIEKQPKGGENA